MKRKKPDPYRLAVFLAIKAQFDPSYTVLANDVWERWCRYARKRRVETGTRRSLSNALRKVGCPWHRADGLRRRVHHGMRLAPTTAVRRPCYGSIYGTDARGRSVYVTTGPVDMHGPLILKKRGLLPAIWVPAEVIQIEGKWYLRELPS